jgi:DNA-binding GntR family transcriptional regulator
MRRMAEDPTLHGRLSASAAAVQAAPDLDERIAADAAYHRALLEASGVGPLMAFNDLLTIFFDRFRRSLESGDWDTGLRQHQEILDALRDGDLKLACDVLTRHVDYHRPRA